MTDGSLSGAVKHASPQFVSLHLRRPQRGAPALVAGEAWANACYRLTDRVAYLTARHALLDLGICTGSEAVAAVEGLLLALLAQEDLIAVAGIAPSFSLAQLVAHTAPAPTPAPTPTPALRLLPPMEVPAFLRPLPVTLLLRLHPPCGITPAIVDRLRRYGLSTLGHIARLDESTLRRQFGLPGGALAALAAGRDLYPLPPIPRPARLDFRLRLHAAAPDLVLAALPHFIARVASTLELRTQAIRELRLTLRWESGSQYAARRTLRHHTGASTLLLQEVRRLLLPVLQADKPTAELRLTLLDFASARPAQGAFAPPRAQRLCVVEQVADTLARRHGHPLLFAPRLVAPDAIFAEDRHRLMALGSDEAAGSPPDGLRDAGGARRSAVQNVWEEVPHRLHWW